MATERELFTVEGIGNRDLYSAGVRYGDLIWTSGQTAEEEDGTLPADFATQVERTLDKIEQALLACGGSLGTILKVTTYLADIDDFAAYNEVYRRRLSGSGLPARTSVQVGRFPRGIRIEIEAVAHATTGTTADPAR